MIEANAVALVSTVIRAEALQDLNIVQNIFAKSSNCSLRSLTKDRIAQVARSGAPAYTGFAIGTLISSAPRAPVRMVMFLEAGHEIAGCVLIHILKILDNRW